MSMTPAFSPGPWITCGPLIGSVRRWTLEDLYEQCSFHMAEKMPSSVRLGSRPIRSSTRWYSSGLRPGSATSSGVIFGELGITLGRPVQHLAQPRKQPAPVGDVVALAMRHRHADHLARIVAAGEWRVGALDPQIDVAADEAQILVAHQYPGQQAGLAQDLEAVADAEHQPALRREAAHHVHDR